LTDGRYNVAVSTETVPSICSAIVNPALLPWNAGGMADPKHRNRKPCPHVEILRVILCEMRPDRIRDPAAGLAPRATKGSDGATNWNGETCKGFAACTKLRKMPRRSRNPLEWRTSRWWRI
jgi:hypothetical protein